MKYEIIEDWSGKQVQIPEKDITGRRLSKIADIIMNISKENPELRFKGFGSSSSQEGYFLTINFIDEEIK